ncbi:hypothetical protein NZNM25_06970 [Nitrosopumilus zosterae]|uniref:Uncharacterized protein n=1 Tax=Nitrosopumilus zosterae TaxID=718286 RepID=A0A2S2KQG7_9ARCH|nr:hypothetical protein [Nitrosopumilus zosterae]GBH33906.1 hypothetical protein NZNM25_06970 [Nitrosopumilus zosterae]
MVNQIENRMLFHDEELDEQDLQKFFEKLDSTTVEQIKRLYEKND